MTHLEVKICVHSVIVPVYLHEETGRDEVIARLDGQPMTLSKRRELKVSGDVAHDVVLIASGSLVYGIKIVSDIIPIVIDLKRRENVVLRNCNEGTRCCYTTRI